MIPYNATNHKPLSLPCGHSICSVAARALYSNKLLKCPADRKIHSFAKFEEIPPNYGMISIIQQTEKELKKKQKFVYHPSICDDIK